MLSSLYQVTGHGIIYQFILGLAPLQGVEGELVVHPGRDSVLGEDVGLGELSLHVGRVKLAGLHDCLVSVVSANSMFNVLHHTGFNIKMNSKIDHKYFNLSRQ